ncbi:Uu.00g027560.m01.CDS01 [Anthostomella pinea]|uniref:GID complex catalytic subunit 2 n=1 Tax=Anthostomella pinea TaxID=933095 RepID=A0AAI8V7T1_9PEZI|nr:Uu.00g027560.m01.CDS01 [Anthostomella pinea]
MAMQDLQRELQRLTGSARLSDAVDDVDKIIDILTSARERVAASNDPHTTSLTLTKLQNPIKEGLDGLKGRLTQINKAHNDFNKSLKSALSRSKNALPMDDDPMESQSALINRAIAMHLLREGQFGVASTFIGEVQPHSEPQPPMVSHPHAQPSSSADAMITDADDLATLDRGTIKPSSYWNMLEATDFPALLRSFGSDWAAIAGHMKTKSVVMVRTYYARRKEAKDWEVIVAEADARKSRGEERPAPPAPPAPPSGDAMITDADIPADLTALQSQELQAQFADMYSILTALKLHDLYPAIKWARENGAELEARGSNIEFELCKLQFVWLFKGPAVNGLPDSPDNGVSGALKYGRENFGRFQHRHLREIQQLSCAMVYSPNLSASPYRSTFDISLAFDEVSASFTREFCSLLGLSAESPLYVAATAGALALPQFVKYNAIMKAKGTEWTTQNELPYETPLPKNMIYHSIFVCPVSKEQTTETNPPMILPCGHVLAKESLQRLAKGSRYKCPYCPSEGVTKDAKPIIL